MAGLLTVTINDVVAEAKLFCGFRGKTDEKTVIVVRHNGQMPEDLLSALQQAVTGIPIVSHQYDQPLPSGPPYEHPYVIDTTRMNIERTSGRYRP